MLPAFRLRYDATRLLAFASVVGVIWYLALFYTTPLPVLGASPETGQPFDRLGFHIWQLLHPSEVSSQWTGHQSLGLNFVDRLPVWLMASLILVSAFVVGRRGLELLGVSSRFTKLESLVFGIGLGLSVLSTFTLAVGLLGGLTSYYADGLFILLLLAGIPSLWSAGTRSSDVDESAQDRRAIHVSVATAVGFGLLILLGSTMPPWHFDVRAYHLQAPKEWFESGAITFLPHNVYATMPLGAEMHALLAMILWPGDDAWWWGALTGKVIIGCFAPLTAIALYATGKRFLTPLAGALAAVVFMTTPWVCFLSFTGLIECAVGFYGLLGLYACAAANAEETAAARRRWLLLAGVMAGSAAACKYPAVAFLVLPLGLLAALRWPGRSIASNFGGLRRLLPSIDVQSAALFSLGMIAASGLWYAKNVAWTGNPTFPLLHNQLGGGDWDPQQHDRWRVAHSPPLDEQGRQYSAEQLTSSLSKLGWLGTGQSPLLLPLVAAALFAVRRRSVEGRDCGPPLPKTQRDLSGCEPDARVDCATTGYRLVWIALGMTLYSVCVWWCLTHRFDRFLTPTVPLVSLAAGVGAAWLLRHSSSRKAVAALLVMGVLLNGLFVTSHVLGDNRFLASLDSLRDDAGQATHFRRLHPSHAFMNRTLGDNDLVLLVGDAAPFDLEVPHLYNTCFDKCQFTQLLRNQSREERVASLRQRGITHVYISWSDIAMYRRQGDYGYSDFVTPRLVYDELTREQAILEPISTGIPRKVGELFRVR